MTKLETLFEDIKTLPIDEQMRQRCDEFQIEEQIKFRDFISEMPVGPNIFLSIKVPGIIRKDICFVCLEREFPGQYIATLWTKINDKDLDTKKPIKRMKVWEIKESDPVKILTKYYEKLTFMRGK